MRCTGNAKKFRGAKNGTALHGNHLILPAGTEEYIMQWREESIKGV
jgi:hypothetical protein